jgi:BlaI family penicillinase repressor
MTIRTRTAASVKAPLTDLENEVMQVVWESGPCAVELVYAAVSRKRRLKETSVRTILRRLEQKGYLRHEERGRAYVYSAAEPARHLAARAVRQIIDRFCKGSVEELVSGMVEARVISRKEMERLEELVRAAKGGK